MERDDRSRHYLTTESSDEEAEVLQMDHIKLGSYYEIDHSELPATSPVQLQMVKIVMVCGKNERVISVRYPSLFSLKACFRSSSGSGNSGGGRESGVKMQKAMRLNPALDEKYSMVNRVAALVLFRHIKPEEFEQSRGSMAFWAAGQSVSGTARRIATRSSGGKVMMAGRGSGGGGSSSSGLTVYQRAGRTSKTGICVSALKSGMVARWGKRQKVRYISTNSDDNPACDDANPRVITPPNEDKSVGEEQLLKGKERSDDASSEDGRSDEEQKEEVLKEEDVSDEEVKPVIPLRRNKKRKCKVVSYNQQSRIPKKQKRETTVRRKMGLTRGPKSSGHKESINRWSADRYKLAEESMLKIMKEKGAVFEKPILRQKLRDEARKEIGDTGLLDHLLKHMAGKVAPGGEERFRRRHNAEGAMEYWLECADLVEIRKMAGVSDPYWKPPPGWKLGDNPSQDPVCAVEIRQLKEEVDNLKRDINNLQLTKGQAEADILATTPLSCVSEQSLVNDLEILPLKGLHEELVKRKFRLEQQLIKVSQYLTEMEEEIEKLSKVEKITKEGSDGTAGCLILESQKNEAAEGNNDDDGKSQTQLEVMDSPGKQNEGKGQTTSPEAEAAASAAAKAEEKSAKIQRLKSGFRICKPHESFKWPNMAAAGEASPMPYSCSSSSIFSSSSQVLSPPTNLEYILAAQTPPSVSSTTTKSPSLLLLTQPLPTQPVKPLARRLSAAAAAAAAIPIPSYLPTLIDLSYAPAAQYSQNCSTEHYGANKLAIYSHSQSSNQNPAMIPGASASLSSNHLQGKYYSMSPRLAAETSRLVAYADENQHKRTSYSANTSPNSVKTNTWVSVPIPDHSHPRKSNQ